MVKKYHNSIKKARNGFVKSNKSFSNSFAKSVKESEFWKKIALEQRPRERLKTKGLDSLNDSELLAIILQNGTHGENVIDLRVFYDIIAL